MISTKPQGWKSDQGIILSGKTGRAVSLEELIEDLKTVKIIYIGEIHTDISHHVIQLKMIQAIHQISPICVGMEMFDQTYQHILDLWSNGNLDQNTFIRKVHWYANWKFDFDLYKDILLYVKENRIQLIGLNIPFHIPPKIAVGGIENLSVEDRKYIPIHIDLSNTAHRAYVEDIFKHHQLKGRDNFEDFYSAQCVWEDGMADTIVRFIQQDRIMIVLVGNGHIIKKFGIPNRAFNKSGQPFRTIYLTPLGAKYDLSYGDYIWLTPKTP